MARAAAEDIPTGTDLDLTIAAITTPVATPMGMTTYGLDIVVKFWHIRAPFFSSYPSIHARTFGRLTIFHYRSAVCFNLHYLASLFSADICANL